MAFLSTPRTSAFVLTVLALNSVLLFSLLMIEREASNSLYLPGHPDVDQTVMPLGNVA